MKEAGKPGNEGMSVSASVDLTHACTYMYTHTRDEHTYTHTHTPQVNPVKRLTISGIKEHTWFKQGLATYLFPLPGGTDITQIDSVALSEVCQKLSVTSSEVIAAVRSEDPHDQLAIAYQLVLDNRVLSKAASEALKSEQVIVTMATSPPKSSFTMKEGLMKDQQFPLPPPSPAKKTPTATTSGSSAVPRIPRTFKRSKWHLGIRSQSRPQDIMAEIFRKLKSLDFNWKSFTPFYIRCRYVCECVRHSCVCVCL